MQLPNPSSHAKPAAEPPAIVLAATRDDVQWGRPVFKAPPLRLHPHAFDAKLFAADLREIGLVGH